MATARQWSVEIIATTYIIMWLHAGKGDHEVLPTPSLPLKVRWPLTSPLRTTRECTPSAYLGRLLWSVNWSSAPTMYATLYSLKCRLLAATCHVCVCMWMCAIDCRLNKLSCLGWHGPFEQQCMPVLCNSVAGAAVSSANITLYCKSQLDKKTLLISCVCVYTIVRRICVWDYNDHTED